MLEPIQSEAFLRRGGSYEQLHHSQKMEAIGRLTAGIAHDFKNLLMIVNGSADQLRYELVGEKSGLLLDAIRGATTRCENLMRQVLSFSHLREVKPQVVDLSASIRDIAGILGRSLRNDIEINLSVPTAPCEVEVDPDEFDLAILNLAVNARDAMPDGGVFTIAITPVAHHEQLRDLGAGFVAINVTDTGIGIPADNLSRIFEPYFTTKEKGKGTGLGLSQVYGFARQAGGCVTIASIPDDGTTVTILIPRTFKIPSVVP